MSRRRSVAVLCLALCASCAPLTGSAPKLGQWGVDLTSLDRVVKPGDNFFLYVNGGWLKTSEIPADRASTGSFQDLQILSEERLKTIVGDLEKKPESQLAMLGTGSVNKLRLNFHIERITNRAHGNVSARAT